MFINSKIDNFDYKIFFCTNEHYPVIPVPLIINSQGQDIVLKVLGLVLDKRLEKILTVFEATDLSELCKTCKIVDDEGFYIYGSENLTSHPPLESIPITLIDAFPSYLYSQQIITTNFETRETIIIRELIYDKYKITDDSYSVRATLIHQ